MLWLIVVALATYFLYVNVFQPLWFWRKRGIPYAKSVPILGNSLRQILRLESIFDTPTRLYNEFPKERFFGMYTFTKPTLCIRDLDLIKKVTVKDFEHFTDHLVLVPREVDNFMGANLFALKGREWREMRSTLSPSFTGSKIRAMFVLMAECAENLTQHFVEKANDEVNEVDLKSIFTKYTNDVIASAAFGIKCDSLANENNKFYEMGNKLVSFTAWVFLKLGLYFAIPTLMTFFKVRVLPKEPVDFFRDVVMETVRTREQQNIYRPDMIQLMIDARRGRLKHDTKSDLDTGFATVEESPITKSEKLHTLKFTDDDITAQALIFFLAGFDSTATTMSFMMLELALNPDVQERLWQEITETLMSCNGQLNYENLVKMSYLDQVVSETLRKWTPGFQTDRLCIKDYTIVPEKQGEKPFTIPKAMQVLIPIRAIHYDSKYFPNPERFDPERFSEENKETIISGSYMPFGVGPRNCIGSRFALLEIKVIAVYLLHKFEIIVSKKTPVSLKLKKSVLAPEGGFWVGLKIRKT